MHMADALLSPAVGGTLWVVTAGAIGCCSRKVSRELDDRKIPLMGVLGAFIFAAQMINFTIPGTGSSGHLGGGMLLAILLGPYAAFLVMASVLMVQALLFADGGLLALGCNIFNLGIFSCFVAYPLVYKPLTGNKPGASRLWLGTILAAVVGLQLGSFGVVLESIVSGVSDLPFATFALLMQPIHLAIGLVEGVVTAAVVSFIRNARPDLLAAATGGGTIGKSSIRSVLAGLLLAALVIGGGLSRFASDNPDGLEWAMLRTTGHEMPATTRHGVRRFLAEFQQQMALFPNDNFPAGSSDSDPPGAARSMIDAGTSVFGFVGGLATLVVATVIGWVLRLRQRRKSPGC
jgi:cobalt/nickel transport system permease protein